MFQYPKISGAEKDIDKFIETNIIDGEFDFNTVVAEPQNEDECPDRYNLNKKIQWSDCKGQTGLIGMTED